MNPINKTPPEEAPPSILRISLQRSLPINIRSTINNPEITPSPSNSPPPFRVTQILLDPNLHLVKLCQIAASENNWQRVIDFLNQTPQELALSSPDPIACERSPLQIAADHHAWEVVLLMLNNISHLAIDTIVIERFFKTPFHLALLFEKWEIVERMLKLEMDSTMLNIPRAMPKIEDLLIFHHQLIHANQSELSTLMILLFADIFLEKECPDLLLERDIHELLNTIRNTFAILNDREHPLHSLPKELQQKILLNLFPDISEKTFNRYIWPQLLQKSSKIEQHLTFQSNRSARKSLLERALTNYFNEEQNLFLKNFSVERVQRNQCYLLLETTLAKVENLCLTPPLYKTALQKKILAGLKECHKSFTEEAILKVFNETILIPTSQNRLCGDSFFQHLIVSHYSVTIGRTMANITLNKISKSFGAKTLFDDVTITFSAGNRYGLTGPNGAGKTTLLKIIMGMEEPTSGSITLPDRCGILRQNIEAYKDFRVLDVVIMGNKRLWDAFQERDRLYEVEMTDDVGMRLGELEGIIAEEDGYSADSNAEVILQGMGLTHDFADKKMSEIPTDNQFRVLLCQALFGDPEALLLDEPTNHLDLESIGWLEKFLFDYKGVLVVISHDRHFLNAVTTHIADIDYETIILYPGNYDMMLVAKTAVRDRSELENKSKEKKIAQLKEFVSKFGAGTRASQVQSRVREIDRLQPQDLKKSNIQRPYIRFIPGDKQPGQIVYKIQGISKSYDDNHVIDKFSIEINRGDKIAVIGNNGRGKTTLLKMLAGVTLPDRGKLERGHQVFTSYFPQNHEDLVDKKLDLNGFDWLKNQNPGVYDQEIRGVMGKMLFGGDDAFKKVKALSGGETARLILGSMMLSAHNVLILDEPNGHLDLEAVSALAWGLEEYKGTVIFASHDRGLIEHAATRIIALEEDGIHVFDGNYEEYARKKAELAAKK